jgi:hypothetical protein
MKKMNSYVTIGMATMLTLTLVAATTIATISTPALATSDQQQRNNFGEGAKHIARGGDNDVTGLMGEHSSDPSGDGRSDPDPRVGIGNIGHPADVADNLCSDNPDSELCP